MTTKKTASVEEKTPAATARVKKASAPARPAATTQAKPVAKPVGKAAVKTQARAVPKQDAKKAKKNHKEKVVRDSFTMPKSEYQKIAEIKETCLKAGMHVKKSEVLRAGLKALCEKTDAQLKQSLRSMEKSQTPKKHK